MSDDEEMQKLTDYRGRVNNDRGGWDPPGGPHRFADLLQADQEMLSRTQWWNSEVAVILVVDQLTPDVDPSSQPIQFRFRRHEIRLYPRGEVFVWFNPARLQAEVDQAMAEYRDKTKAPVADIRVPRSDPRWMPAGQWSSTQSTEGDQTVILVMFLNDCDIAFGRLLEPVHDPYADKHGN
jgi:hypothetical protein